jgi:hypothetical protein
MRTSRPEARDRLNFTINEHVCGPGHVLFMHNPAFCDDSNAMLAIYASVE